MRPNNSRTAAGRSLNLAMQEMWRCSYIVIMNRAVTDGLTPRGRWPTASELEYLQHSFCRATPPSYTDGAAVKIVPQSKYLGSISPKRFKIRVFFSNVASVLAYGLPTLALENKHLQNLDSWFFRYLRRVLGVKASYCSRMTNQPVWYKANRPLLPSQLIISQQLAQLISSINAPHNDPIHHVVFSAG